MVKKYISKFLFHPIAARLYVKPALKAHNFMYRLATKASTIVENNKHPKHDILKYKEWFGQHIGPDDVVLDIGSNSGSLPIFLSSVAQYVYGIEIVKELHQESLKRCKADNLKFILGDATSYNYSTIKSVSVVTLSNVLEHIEFRVEFLKKIVSSLEWQYEDNRRLLIRVPMLDRDWITIYKKNHGIEWRLDLTHYTEYTKDSFFQEMKQANLLVVEFDIRFGELYAVCVVRE